ncbi:F-box/FBD/LRR-repeat protein [Citrus sinensis]|uniref:F-box/FBD/LRR-repeat protein n=1 Tax=Citrus sinensis TaxID=2711 RepID=A0ACB8NZG4_CITSI|nr:F-box/FBD/LRR-repeat protein [Citrus sinensis]
MENALQRSPKISKLTCGVCSNVGGEDGDRLSNLPEPIVHHIFSFLETIDVVRVSAVSRKWRYLWLSIPYLNFNIQNIWSNPLERWSLQTTNEKFKDFVNWVLLFQNGSLSIHRFRLSCLNRVDDYTLYKWIAVVARRNVQVLDLDIISDEPIKLPRSLVTCESLVSLKLDFGNREYQGVLNLPTCAGFSWLKSLDLQHVDVLDYNLFREFLSSCPLLENLYMKECFFHNFSSLDISTTSLKYLTVDEFLLSEPKGLRSCKVICESLEALKLHFGREIDNSPLLENLKMDSRCFPDLKILDISSNSLKSLTLERIEFGGDELDNYKLKIACSNLKSFNIFAPLLPDFNLKGLNSLQNAFIFLETIGEHMGTKEICHRMSKILNGLHDVKVLKLSCTLYQGVFSLVCLCTVHYELLLPHHVMWLPSWAAHNWTHRWAALLVNIQVDPTECGRSKQANFLCYPVSLLPMDVENRVNMVDLEEKITSPS